MLIFPKPYTHETLQSFIYRVAKENLMDNPSWIFDCLDNRYSIKLKKNMVNWLQDEQLEVVAGLLRIPFKQAKALTLLYDVERMGLEAKNVRKNPWFLYGKTRFCPDCLREGVFQRKMWVNSQSIICLKHEQFLLDKCEYCKNISNTKDIIQNICPKCNKFLSYSQAKPAQAPKLLEYQRTINQIIIDNHFNYNHSWINNSTTFMKTVEFLALWVAKLINPECLSMYEENINFEGNVLERNHIKNFKSIEQAICLYNYTFNIIDNWPHSFYRFLESAEQNSEKNFISFLKYGVPKLVNSDLWPISKEVTNFLAKKKFSLVNKEYIRADEIKHLNSKFNGNIIHSKLLKTEELIYKGLKLNITEKSSVDDLIKKLQNSYTKEDLMNYWGTSRKATFTILQSGLIEGVHSFSTGSLSTWVIPIDSILNIDIQLKERAMPYIQSPISLGNAFQWVGPHLADLILKGMLNNYIKFKNNGSKLTQVLINKRDCYIYIKEKIINNSAESGYFKIRDIVFLLGVKQSDIRYWLQTERFGPINHFESNIPRDYFLNFTNQYITTFELSMELNINIKQVLKKYSIGKLKSISGPEFNDGKRLLFYKNDGSTMNCV